MKPLRHTFALKVPATTGVSQAGLNQGAEKRRQSKKPPSGIPECRDRQQERRGAQACFRFRVLALRSGAGQSEPAGLWTRVDFRGGGGRSAPESRGQRSASTPRAAHPLPSPEPQPKESLKGNDFSSYPSSPLCVSLTFHPDAPGSSVNSLQWADRGRAGKHFLSGVTESAGRG